MFDVLKAYWPYVLGVAGSIAGIVAFFSQVLQVRKLKYEIARMRQQAAADKQLVRVATLDETERYGVRRPMSQVRRSQQVIVLSVLLVMTGPIIYVLYEPSGPISAAPPQPSSATALDWLVLIDGGNYAAAWDRADETLRSEISQSAFVAMVAEARAPLGKVVQRELLSTSRSRRPSGEVINRQVFSTLFEIAGRRSEVVTLRVSNGQWNVYAYNILPAP